MGNYELGVEDAFGPSAYIVCFGKPQFMDIRCKKANV